MAHQLPGGSYLTVAEAVELMGCTDGWIRNLIRTGKLDAIRAGKRTWLIPAKAAAEARDELTSRSNGKRHTAERPAALRKAPKKAKKASRKG